MKTNKDNGYSSFDEIDSGDESNEEIKHDLSKSKTKPEEPLGNKCKEDGFMNVQENKADTSLIYVDSSIKVNPNALIVEKPCSLSAKAISKLDAWRAYTKHGKPVEGTNIIPCKAFLHKSKWVSELKPEEQFDISSFVQQMNQEGKPIGAIVDINLLTSYYHWDNIYAENHELLKKIEYRKVKVPFNELPLKKEMERIYDVLNRHAFKNHYVLIHCTHGINRTGYAICYFLCKKYNMPVRDAVKRFEEARGYPFEYPDLVQDLIDRFDDRIMRECINPHS